MNRRDLFKGAVGALAAWLALPDSLSALVAGVGRGSPRILDNFGMTLGMSEPFTGIDLSARKPGDTVIVEYRTATGDWKEFHTIGDAVMWASPGDTIFVLPPARPVAHG